MREALRGLTGRGRCFLYGAAAAALCALILGEKDLLRIAVLLVVLPLLAAWNVGRSRYRLACTRVLEPARVQVGMTSRVLLRLENLSGFTTGTLLLEDRLPYSLGSRPRLVLERLARRHASSVAYTVRADVRGRFEVGPLVVRLTDPFGLCELTRSFPSVDHLVVIPQVVPLPMMRLAGEYAGAGESHARSVAVHGDDDAATREYRYGDDLRRVHWRSTARTGELMVRREEQPWESRATILLDTRAVGPPRRGSDGELRMGRLDRREHRRAPQPRRLQGAAGDRHRHRHRGQRRRHRDPRPPGRGAAHAAGRPRHGDRHRCGVAPTAASSSPCSAWCGRPRRDLLGSLRRSGTTCVAFMINSTTWLNLPTADRAEADDAHTAAGLGLLRTGWRVIDVPHGSKLSTLWPQVARGSQGFAYRAAMAETVSGGVR